MIYAAVLFIVVILSVFILTTIFNHINGTKETAEDLTVWHYRGMILPKTNEQVFTFVYYSAEGSAGSVEKLVFRKHRDTIISNNLSKNNSLYSLMKQSQSNLLKNSSYESFEKEWCKISKLSDN